MPWYNRAIHYLLFNFVDVPYAYPRHSGEDILHVFSVVGTGNDHYLFSPICFCPSDYVLAHPAVAHDPPVDLGLHLLIWKIFKPVHLGQIKITRGGNCRCLLGV